MAVKAIIDALREFDRINYTLDAAYEESFGEVTDTTDALEEQRNLILGVLEDPEGLDELGRWLAAKQAKEQQLKDEAARIARMRKQNDATIDFIKGVVRKYMDARQLPKASGLMYSFSSTTKEDVEYDTDEFKAVYQPLVKDALTAAHIPPFVGVSLTLSKTGLEAWADINGEYPEGFSKVVTDTVKFVKPRKSTK